MFEVVESPEKFPESSDSLFSDDGSARFSTTAILLWLLTTLIKCVLSKFSGFLLNLEHLADQSNCRITLNYGIIGASLSEPHIDGDVRPTSRGMFVYMYLAVWCVCPPYVPEKSRARTH